jgi:glycosyltransferase involved in cell wall biosynthesis
VGKTAQRLVVVVNWRDLSHPQAGGAEVVCEMMAARLAAEGNEVVLLTSSVGGSPKTQRRDGYTIRRAGGRFTVYPLALLWLLVHRRSVHTVLDSQNGIPFFTPLAVKPKTTVLLLIWHVHQEQFSAYFPRPIAALGRWLETSGTRAVYRSRTVVTISPSTRAGIVGDLRLSGPVRVIPLGWTLSLDVDGARRPRTAHPTIVAVGRLVPHKRARLIVEAMPEVLRAHPDTVLHLVGSGVELTALMARVSELGLSNNVAFRSDCTNHERDELVSRAWLSINASAGEGWGISVIEANALGIPVLAFDRPGLQDSIVDNVTGWLIEEGESLARATTQVVELLGNEDAAEAFSRRALRWASRFTWAATGDQLLSAIAAETDRINSRSARTDSDDLADWPPPENTRLEAT